jgi:hypothetical protein
MPDTLREIKSTVALTTNAGAFRCEACGENIFGDDVRGLSRAINHYIDEHGYELLHVGTETQRANEGLWHHAVAVLGISDE